VITFRCGWLDGILGVNAGVGVLAALAGGPARPRRTLAVVDWADEEGARFGRSLLGSGAAVGALTRRCSRRRPRRRRGPCLRSGAARNAQPTAGRGRRDGSSRASSRGRSSSARGCGRRGLRLPERPTVPLRARRPPATPGRRQCRAVAIRRGPWRRRSRRSRTPPRRSAAWRRSASWGPRRRSRRRSRAAARSRSTSATPTPTGSPRSRRGPWRWSPTRRSRAAARRAASRSGRSSRAVRRRPHRARGRCGPRRRAVGVRRRCTTAAALAQLGIPATMLFTPSIGGISHTRDEDTSEADLVCALEALAALELELAGARARGDGPPAISRTTPYQAQNANISSRAGPSQTRVFPGISPPQMAPTARLKIVVSPVRVRVSPSQEFPANGPLSCRNVATRHERLRATGGRKVPNEVPMNHGL
jgi:hypothetical protein